MKRKKGPVSPARTSQRCNKAKGKVDEAEGHELCPYFANLPSHLTAHILLQLPIKSLLICKCVCKIWKTMISGSHFAKLQFEGAPSSLMIRTDDYRPARMLYLLDCEPKNFELGRNNHVKLESIFKLQLEDAKLLMEKKDTKLDLGENDENNNGGRQNLISCNIDHAKFNVVNSCNGLLCLCDPFNETPLVICNPVTGEFIRLPEATMTPAGLYTKRVLIQGHVGFGYQPKTNDYKVIEVRTRHVRVANDWVFERAVLEIHTLGTTSWRNVEVDPQISIWSLNYPTCVNSALHWIKFDFLQMSSILCFNLENERFQSFPSPPHVFRNDRIINRIAGWRINMGELRGFLYICDSSSFFDVTIWVMKKYGLGESWTKVYNIDTSASPLGIPKYSCSGFCWPVKQFEKSACILFYNSCNCLIYYEPEKHGFKVFQIHGAQSKVVKVIPYIPSLISLKDAVKGDNFELLNIHSRCAKSKLGEESEVFSLVQAIVSDLTNKSSSSSDAEKFGGELAF